MSSDGKGVRKLRAPLCAKCGDSGEMTEWSRSKGRVTTAHYVPCPKNCLAAQRKKGERDAKTIR